MEDRRGFIALGVCMAAMAMPAAAGAAPLGNAAVDLHLNSNTLENLSELGVLSRAADPAHYVAGNLRFPFDHGHLKTGRHRHGRVHGFGGGTFARDDGRSVTLNTPTIVINRHSATLEMLVQSAPVQVARVPNYKIARQGRRVEIKGLAKLTQAGADAIAMTFDSPYPHPETPLGSLHIGMRLSPVGHTKGPPKPAFLSSVEDRR